MCAAWKPLASNACFIRSPLHRSLLREWVGLAVSEWPAPRPGEATQPLAGFDSLHRVEGAALVLLCSTDVEVRRRACWDVWILGAIAAGVGRCLGIRKAALPGLLLQFCFSCCPSTQPPSCLEAH